MVVPNAIAGAVSVRPQAAGAASGISGFMQMGLGAIVTQFVGWALEGAASALALTVTMFGVSVVAVQTLVRR
jgi:DHA1 family bicyclomycin/chloramphenicol resistance-like MFS transporter